MTERTESEQGRQRRRWWRLYVHQIQKRYAVFVGIIGFVYGFLVLVLALLGGQSSANSPLRESVFFGEYLAGAAEFLFLGETTWPAIICILIPSAVIFSLYLTHRVAGPLYRFEQSAQELKKGNLCLRIRLREGDELQGLAEALNATVKNLDEAFIEVRDREAVERSALRRCYEALKGQSSTDQELLKTIEAALHDAERVDHVFKRFQLSAPQSQP